MRLQEKSGLPTEKIAEKFGSIENYDYLCTRIQEKPWCLDLRSSHLALEKAEASFAFLLAYSVPWMSGLVNGLQNRLRRFESARHLKARQSWRAFFIRLRPQTFLSAHPPWPVPSSNHEFSPDHHPSDWHWSHANRSWCHQRT